MVHNWRGLFLTNLFVFLLSLVFSFFCSEKTLFASSGDLSNYKYFSEIAYGKIRCSKDSVNLKEHIKSLENKKIKYRLIYKSHKYITLLKETEHRTMVNIYYKNKETCKQISQINNQILMLDPKEDFDRFIRLMNKGANVNTAASYPLIYKVIQQGNLNLLKVLKEKGADINIRDRDGKTPLSVASWNGYKEIVKYLVKNGAYINYGLHPPLCEAAYSGETEILKILLENGGDVNFRDEEKRSPLHCAAMGNQLKVIQLLMASGAKIESKDNYNNSPLHLAVHKNKLEAVRLLLSQGAEIDAIDNDGKSPVFFSLVKSKVDILKLLLSKGANINQVSNDNAIPLHFAAENGSLECAKLLIQKGSKINITTKNIGFSVLHKAVLSENIALVQILLDNGVNPDLKTVKDFYIGGLPSNHFFPKGSTALDFAKILKLENISLYLQKR